MDNRITGVQLDAQDIVLSLADGRVLKTPIKRYVRVEGATPEQRLKWVLTDDDHGVNWPELWTPAPDGMVSVWELDQDVIYNGALGRLHAAGWNLADVSEVDREIVALWRMEADINNGGFMQFFCNWGEETFQLALKGLDRIGAPAMRALMEQMFAVFAHYGDTDEVISLADLPGMLTEEENERLEALENTFWDYPDRMDKLVVLAFSGLVPPVSDTKTN